MALKLQMGKPDKNAEDGKKAELTEHLAELRTRLIRASLYIIGGMVLMYFLYNPVYDALTAPINRVIQKLGTQHQTSGLPTGAIVFTSFTEAFMLRLQVATVGGLILALPIVMMELWGFIEPALTSSERKGVLFVAPMSVILFILGLSCAYFVLPMAVTWFLSFLPSNTVLFQNPLTYLVFTIKLMLVFGLLFQLPVVLMFLGKVGIISSALMIQYWRQIAVGLFTLAMVVAPSNDPGTMLALAVPLTLLFFASIGLVKLVEPRPKPSPN